MSRFYGDINKVRCKYLLEATPYRIDPMVNFSNRLSEKEFYEHLFQRASTGTNYKENDLFEKKILDAIKDMGNEYSKVEMIHIAGYGGCGKTTFVRHLLWKMYENDSTSYDVLDYEGSQTAADPILNKISNRLYALQKSTFWEFLEKSANEEIFNMNRFQFCVRQLSRLILTILREKGNRCSMLDLYGLLEPFFGIDEITSTTWALSENCREI